MGGNGTKLKLEHFEKSVNNAAGRVRGLWLGYIALVAYLIITVGSVTHRDLFLENPVTLPVLNVKLSLIGFFAVAPIFFLINHFYLLLHLVGLRRRIAEYDEAIKGENLGDKEDIRRRELDSFVVVQAFGGSQEERSGKTGWFLKTIIWITVIIAPIVVLQQMQIGFLAYHHEGITWVHRIATLIDLGFLWLFWPAIHHGYPTLKWFQPNDNYTTSSIGNGTGLIMIFSLLIATFPGEQIDKSGIGGETKIAGQDWRTPEDWVLWPVKLLLPRNLDLRNEFLIDRDLLEKIGNRKPDSEKLYQGERTLVLSSNLKVRNLTGADFRGADLRGVDLSAANMQDSLLFRTKLQDSSLEGANLQGASLNSARLQGASLDYANLQGASLDDARMQGASFEKANLQGASLRHARLQGASFDYANLQGASLDHALLQSASFDSARLQGATLRHVILLNTSFKNTYIWRTQSISHTMKAYLFNLNFTQIAAYDDLIEAALKGITNIETRENIKKRLSLLKLDTKTPQQYMEMAKYWARLKKISLSKFDYQIQLTDRLRKLACASSHRPYIAEGLTRRNIRKPTSRILATGSNVRSLAHHLLNATSDTCPGVVDIDARAKAELHRIVADIKSKSNR